MAQRLAAVVPTVPGSPVLDIAIPVYNEARDLERNVRRLRHYLDDRFNASMDATWDLARGLAQELPGVRFRRLLAEGASITVSPQARPDERVRILRRTA